MKILKNPELGEALAKNALRVAEERFNYLTYLNKLKYAYELLDEKISGKNGGY